MIGSGYTRCPQISTQTFSIVTQYGDMQVIKQGAHLGQVQHNHQPASSGTTSDQQLGQARPVIMTFHDLGLNSELQFSKFCECEEVRLMMQTFNMVHVNFIGQEFISSQATSDKQRQQLTCKDLGDDFKYPSVEQLAECIVDVCTQLRLRSFIALAVGAGAHIVSLLALRRPDLIDGLFLINPVITSCSITEWLYFKMSAIGQHQQSHASGDSLGQPVSPQRDSNIRRLLNAVHLNSATRSAHEERESSKATTSDVEDTQSLNHVSTGSSGETSRHQQSGSRLRRLILSRNFRFSQHHQSRHHLQRQQSSGSGRDSSTQRKLPGHSESVSECELSDSPTHRRRHQLGGQHQHRRRPPVEYLMYHHFGPSSFQRYRRSSDTPTLSGDSNSSSPKRSLGSDRTDSSPKLGPSECRSGRLAAFKSQSRSHDSLACQSMIDPVEREAVRSAAGTPVSTDSPRSRTESVSLSASHLASLSDRQRHAHVQNIYRHYFGQLNANNLWLFAQSFAKRKALSLRKDCGAAAHAAAAAAALGTSICTAFVGTAPVSTGAHYERQGAAGSEAPAHATEDASKSSGSATTCGQPQAQVAGTKVKRTFTCQTLIMCSSVQMHCERAFKLMSLLNPLQATWIKTDQLLVLEERPDKVCQALRLFLQGIGYSMSTYERRLRLSSARGSASSADSAGSARSLASDKG